MKKISKITFGLLTPIAFYTSAVHAALDGDVLLTKVTNKTDIDLVLVTPQKKVIAKFPANKTSRTKINLEYAPKKLSASYFIENADIKQLAKNPPLLLSIQRSVSKKGFSQFIVKQIFKLSRRIFIGEVSDYHEIASWKKTFTKYATQKDRFEIDLTLDGENFEKSKMTVRGFKTKHKFR